MFRPRTMPCLLLCDGGFVKTEKFKSPRYIGDPVNVINLFNKLMADEIILLDIHASRDGREPDIDLIAHLAEECTAPLCYGGGVTSIEQIKAIFEAGVEKIVLNTALKTHPGLIEEAASLFGSQAVIVSIDVRKKRFKGYQAYVKHGKLPLKKDPVTLAKEVTALGAGELLIHSIDKDGTMSGYDLDLIKQVSHAVSTPVIACGGAGSREDLLRPVQDAGCSAVAAGSLFVYKGQERGILINFPPQKELEALFAPLYS